MNSDTKLLLVDAIRRGDAEEVRELLMSGVSPNSLYRGWSPLHWASQWGRHGIVRTLLESGARVDKRDANGFTPLLVAVGENRLRTVKLLLDQGADIHMKTHAVGNGQPIHLAAAWGYLPIVKLLLTRGADLEVKDEDGNTALDFAKRYRHVNVVRFLRGWTRRA